jgi:dienelactone hydrolase
MKRFAGILAVILALLAATPRAARSETAAGLVSIATPRGAKQAFILIKPEKPVASVILFAGGEGALRLKGVDSMGWGKGNFLVRTRNAFAAHNLMVAVVDAPSDYQRGMNAKFRQSGAHAGDIGAVVAYLKKEAPLPVWLVGTSMGTLSAAQGAIAVKGVDGLVLTSTITRAKREWVKVPALYPNGVASLPLQRVTVPALIVSHANDGCPFTPAADIPKLRARLTNAKPVDAVVLSGGDPPRSEPCEAFAQHGFLGVEDKAVDTIAGFILANGK